MGKSAVKTFCYKPEEYPEIHDWLENLPAGTSLSEAIRGLILADIRGDDAEDNAVLEQIQEDLREIKACLAQGVSLRTTEGAEEDALPEDVLANLDSLVGL